MKIKIRTPFLENNKSNKIKLCKHISVEGIKTRDIFPACEYEEDLHIFCNECKVEHLVTICVN